MIRPYAGSRVSVEEFTQPEQGPLVGARLSSFAPYTIKSLIYYWVGKEVAKHESSWMSNLALTRRISPQPSCFLLLDTGIHCINSDGCRA
jgi:hypothetical protein